MATDEDLSMGLDTLRLAGGLIMLMRALDQKMRALGGPTSVTIKALGVLASIERGADQPSLLARAMYIDPAQVTHLTDDLVALGYIEREVDQADRRRWRLTLTVEGRDRLASGRTDLRTIMEGLLSGLSDDEQAGLARGLEGVRRILTQQSAPTAVS